VVSNACELPQVGTILDLGRNGLASQRLILGFTLVADLRFP
jgi:hypothetical protein